MNKVKIISFIPARSGSKGLKNKNILVLKNMPLIGWSIKSSLKSKSIQKTFVSTESQKYATISKKYGAEILDLRPRYLARDTTEDYDVIIDFIKRLHLKSIYPDFLVHLRPTTPLRSHKIIDKAIRYFQKKRGYDSLRSVHEMSESAYKSLMIKKGCICSINNLDINLVNKPRQIFPKTYIANGYVDIYRVESILKHKTLLGKKSLPFLTNKVTEVDNIDDFNYLKYQLNLHNVKKNNYKK